MERTVPSTASEEIALYLQTMYSLLRSTAEVQIRTLEEVHAGMNSTLHPDVRSQSPDTSAFIYSILRLPVCISNIRSIIMGQSVTVFAQHGYKDIESWKQVTARARRRRIFFDGKQTLAVIIASRSDIEDIIPILTAYQIEWNKIHRLLQRYHLDQIWQKVETDPRAFEALAQGLEMSSEDLERLRVIWGNSFTTNLLTISERRCNFRIKELSGSLSDYWRATRAWLDNIVRVFPELVNRPVYFVSSNPHSIPNLLSGFALQRQEELIKFLERDENSELFKEWNEIRASDIPSSPGNFLYYVLKKFQQTEQGKHLIAAQIAYEQECSIIRIPSEHSFDVEAQVFEISRLNPNLMDVRLNNRDWSFLKRSDALILNIDYPLGLAAYNILVKVAELVGSILGVYSMGKAATLNGVVGDVMIPTIVYDEHSKNTYMFKNAFSAADVSPYLVYGTVLDNQKAVSVLGTFLQNARIMDVIYREGYTDIEMEAGPFLSAVYEMFRPKRHPVNEIISLHRLPFDLGMVHYASDKPMSKGKNLGAGTLSYFGMDSTYATSIAILRRIFELESERVKVA